MKVVQEFKYTGSVKYDFSNIQLNENEVALFDAATGIGGIDYIPYDGATVNVFTGLINTDPEVQDLQPSLNNKVYYLVTDVEYTDADKDTIISLATEIPVTLAGGRYEGSFVFSNPNNFTNLYLIWDYRDTITSGVGSYSGLATFRSIDIDLGTDIGRSTFNYNNSGDPTRFAIEYNNGLVFDSGYVGLNSLSNYNDLIAEGIDPNDIKLVFPYDGLVNNGVGSAEFSKTLQNVTSATLYVSSPLSSNSWIVSASNPVLTSFYIDTTDGDISNVCSQVPSTEYWHNGSGSVPVSGDTIYTVSDGSSVYDGNSSFHLVNETSLVVPPSSGGRWIVVSDEGIVTSNSGCDCTEYAVPYIYQDDIYVTENTPVSVRFAATNNPTLWKINTSCETYEITGGSFGSLYTYTDCNGNNKSLTININSTQNICTSSVVTLVQGDGSATLIGPCQDKVLPNGLSFDLTLGILSGIPTESCSYELEVEASNCIGDSLAKKINITVDTGVTITPFAIDVENIGDTGDAACAIDPVYTLLYHNGNGRIPDVNDTIFIDYKASEKFMGGGMWYKIDNSTYSIKVCETGNVCDKNECPSVTTTTTSTTTTTTTTTLPTGDWFNAELCSNPSITAVMVDTSSAGFTTGDIVKTVDGNCWEITGTTTGSFPYLLIDAGPGSFLDCASCYGITTTTTTTTTTTAPSYTSFMIRSDQYMTSYDACMNDLPLDLTLYHNGVSAYPVVGNFVFTDALGTTPFNGASRWYYFLDGTAYSMQVSITGQVLNVVNCSGVTTTTTTTTMPTYYYYAKPCLGGGNVIISYQGFTPLANGIVVKASDNQCYFDITIGAPATPVASILFTYEKCSDCTGITTTTTTTSTTTTSTTTTSTTTTTTTAPPLFSVFVRKDTEENVCSGIIIERFADGPLGTIGKKLYEWTGTAYVLVPAAWYKLITSSTAYEWDGTNWTGNSTSC